MMTFESYQDRAAAVQALQERLDRMNPDAWDIEASLRAQLRETERATIAPTRHPLGD